MVLAQQEMASHFAAEEDKLMVQFEVLEAQWELELAVNSEAAAGIEDLERTAVVVDNFAEEEIDIPGFELDVPESEGADLAFEGQANLELESASAAAAQPSFPLQLQSTRPQSKILILYYFF